MCVLGSWGKRLEDVWGLYLLDFSVNTKGFSDMVIENNGRRFKSPILLSSGSEHVSFGENAHG